VLKWLARMVRIGSSFVQILLKVIHGNTFFVTINTNPNPNLDNPNPNLDNPDLDNPNLDNPDLDNPNPNLDNPNPNPKTRLTL
jgi:hypothetical protein